MLRTVMPTLLKRLFRIGDEPEPQPAEAIGTERSSYLDTVQSLRQRYPFVRSLAFSLSIKSPDALEATLNGRSFGPDAKAYFRFNCKNVECLGGGFDLTREIDDMVTARRREITGRRVCQGEEGGRRCLYELNFKAVAAYED